MVARSDRITASVVGFALVLAVMVAPGVEQSAYADDDDDDVLTIVVHKKQRRQSGSCASCGVVTFRIPSPSQAENNKRVDYETSRKPNEADAALLFQCASLLEQIQSKSISS